MLLPGEALFVSFSKLPESRLVIPGEHFTFDPPRRDRKFFRNESNRLGGKHDLGRAARLEAKVPLLMTIDVPWLDARGGVEILGCATILHLRLARNTPLLAEMAKDHQENSPEKNILQWESYKLRIASVEAGKEAEHVVGGPAYAAVYEDEIVVPGYRTEDRAGNSRVLPWAHIIHQDEVGPLEHAFKQGGREKYLLKQAAQSGSPVDPGIPAQGPLVTATLGKGVEVSVDSTGRVFAIVNKGMPLFSARLNAGPKGDLVTVTMRQMVTNPYLRADLGLPELERSQYAPRITPDSRGLVKVFQETDEGAGKPLAASRSVPTVERRTKKPSPSSVVPGMPEPKTEEAPSTALSVPVHVLDRTAPVEFPSDRLIVLPPDKTVLRDVTRRGGLGLPAPVYDAEAGVGPAVAVDELAGL